MHGVNKAESLSSTRWKRRLTAFILALTTSSLIAQSALASDCPAEQSQPLVPTDQALCRALDPVVKDPSALPTAAYQKTLDQYFRAFCHRDSEAGWVRDKYVRDTGPATAQIVSGQWKGAYHGTHMPVVIWYSPEMFAWIKSNRTEAHEDQLTDNEPVPDGAVMVKEMYPAPASLCADVDPLKLLPVPSGAAIMIRDNEASKDGWYWGWYGYEGWAPDFPANPDSNALANMGFGAYCMNCHASARDNLTFSSAKNIEGQPGEPLVFLSQDEDPTPAPASGHDQVVLPDADSNRLGRPYSRYDTAFLEAYATPSADDRPSWDTVSKMPSETYDDVHMPAGHPTVEGEFLPSAQCLGCHDAGSTGLQFDMTEIDPAIGKLWNLSPYATWRTSPMGLAGRDPIFFAQLSSETQTFHPDKAGIVQNTCLGCHGILGQRQFGIDQAQSNPPLDGKANCGTFTRDMVDAVPFPPDNPSADHADFGALARDGISCMACHRMVLGEEASAAVKDDPQNACVEERQAFLNPKNTGFGKTFTGSFLVSKPDELYGPFPNPRQAPMETALGIKPVHNATIQTSEVCGTCHTVHLPVMHNGDQVATVYEQLTYPEWAFSAYRTGTSPDGPLPGGKGEISMSCQSCHMPNKEPDGSLSKSRIASIQEHSNFPEAEFSKPAHEIDIPVREGYARHDLVGLNIFLTKMAQQFPDVLGIRTTDPMLVSKGVDPLIRTEQVMLDQAANATAAVSITKTVRDGDTLIATVRVDNKTGHKFPSGVGFRRAFLSFEVLDRLGEVLWASGRTDGAGRLLNADGSVLAGEQWWADDCSARIEPEKRLHQPHYQTITAQDQVQVYQELVSTPPETGKAQCGHAAEPAGQLTTSFLSICAEVKDNRLLPHGYLDLPARKAIAAALGAGEDMAEDAGSTAVGNDLDYRPGGPGGDTLVYRIDTKGLDGRIAGLRARLFYQATPPFYLQDRFCTAKGKDRDRLYFLGGHLNLDGTRAEDWKFLIADTGVVAPE
jgi:hypothetical protein